MTGIALIDVAIGVVFSILTFSLVAGALTEALAAVLNWRGRMLRRGLFRLLENAAASDGLVHAPRLRPSRLKRAELTLAVLADPSVRVLHGPRGLAGQLWDRLAGWRRGAAERHLAALGRTPSAIPRETFARALIDALAARIAPRDPGSAAEPGATRDETRRAADALARRVGAAVQSAAEIDGLPMDAGLKRRLRRVLAEIAVARRLQDRLAAAGELPAALRADLDARLAAADGAREGLVEDLAGWFDAMMDRVSGWYERRTKLALFAIGFGLAMAVNLDLVGYAGRLVGDAGERQRIVARADRARLPAPPGDPAGGARAETATGAAVAVLSHPVETLRADLGDGLSDLGRVCAPGESWVGCVARTWRWSSFLSWLLIGFGSTLGGQYWFELLQGLLKARTGAAAAGRAR